MCAVKAHRAHLARTEQQMVFPPRLMSAIGNLDLASRWGFRRFAVD